jgi:hypothetical protein
MNSNDRDGPQYPRAACREALSGAGRRAGHAWRGWFDAGGGYQIARRGPGCALRRGARCALQRTSRGYLLYIGSCWCRRHPWSPLSWRMAGPHG